METDDIRAAATQFARTHSLFPDTPEGTAAALQNAEAVPADRARGRVAGRIPPCLGGIAGPDGYNNPWLPLEQVKARLTADYQSCLVRANTTRPCS